MHRQATLLLALTGFVHAEAVQHTFEFHNGFWVNLHHTLYQQASGIKAGRTPNLSTLSPAEAAIWNEALNYYERDVINHDLLDIQMTLTNRTMAAAGNGALLKPADGADPVIRILEKAAPIYRAHWWIEHDRKNREWIDRVTPLIAQHEDTLRPALSRAYNASWPKRRIHVEMSYYTTGNSAYTSLGPTLITISSWSQRNEGPAALETIFHEAGHSLIHKVQAELDDAAKRRGRKPVNEDLWHAVLFYTSGELIRRQVPELIPYAEKYQMWEKTWPNILPVLEKDWKPFLDGRARFKPSLDRLVADCP
jgi:hypothetical protein